MNFSSIYENKFRRNREEARRKFQVERTREKEEGRKTENGETIKSDDYGRLRRQSISRRYAPDETWEMKHHLCCTCSNK